MWPYLPALLERPVPRYTSYPTAAEFTPGIGAVEQRAALERLPRGEPVSLYLHLPFCQEICWYCGCNTGRANRTHRLEAYLDALGSEIDTVGMMIGSRVVVDRIAFGGGSPNAISPVGFIRLLNQLIVRFALGAAILSVELDPRGFGEDWALTLGGAGASRVSLGVQTFDPAIQAAIGRIQPYAMIARAVERLRRHGIGSINFDLMYGLPGQDRASLDATLDETLRLKPERIALFGYAHVPDLIPRQKRILADRLADQAERFAMAEHGHDRLVAAGYVPVGFDHFALPGDPMGAAALAGRLHRNFQGFTDDGSAVLLGLGASAISAFPDRFVQNEKAAGPYRAAAVAGALAGTRGVLRDADDRARAIVIEDLLCGRPADLAGLPDTPDLTARLAPFLAHGLAVLEGGLLRLTPAALPYARTIASLFDRYRAQAVRQFSSAI